MISLVSPWWSYQSDGVGEYDWGPPGSEWSRPARPSPRWNTSQHPLRHHTHPSAPLRPPPAALLRLAAGGNGSSRTSASQSSWRGRRKVENALVCSKIIWKLSHPKYCIFISIYNTNKNKKNSLDGYFECVGEVNAEHSIYSIQQTYRKRAL